MANNFDQDACRLTDDADAAPIADLVYAAVPDDKADRQEIKRAEQPAPRPFRCSSRRFAGRQPL